MKFFGIHDYEKQSIKKAQKYVAAKIIIVIFT